MNKVRQADLKSIFKPKKARRSDMKSIIFSPALLLMVLPGFALLILFRYVPMLNIVVAFKDYNIFQGVWASPWVGFKHFQVLFTMPKFYSVLGNTFAISALKILFGFPAPIILALIINQVTNAAYKRIVQNIFYLPHFISWVVIAGLCFDIFSKTGVINAIASALGFPVKSYLMDPQSIRGVLVITDIWKDVGWGSIIYLAALTSIDPELYNAAKIDGAGWLARILHITLPEMADIIITMFILRLSSVLSVGLDQILMLDNARVTDVITVLDTYVWYTGISKGQYDFTTAVGLFTSLVNAAFILTANAIVKSKRGEGLW